MKHCYGFGALFIFSCVFATPGYALAQGRVSSLPPSWTAVAPERLDTLRGGYSLPSGLNLSFGIARAVYINGALVTSTSVNIADIGKMTAEEARALAAATAPLLVQNGPGNMVTQGNGPAGVTIQNSLDDQTIRSMTTLSVSVDTLDLYKALNVQSTLQDALNRTGGQ